MFRTSNSAERLALVCMPWCSATLPSLALSSLKTVAQSHGYKTDVHYMNLLFAQRIGFRKYEKIAVTSAIFPEWFFSRALFGDASGCSFNSLRNLEKTAEGSEFVDNLVRNTCGSVSECEWIADQVPPFCEDALGEVNWGSYDAIGFTATHAQLCSSLYFARLIKLRHPEVLILLGGSAVQDDMGANILKEFEWVDCIVHGEGEGVLPRILSTARNESAMLPMNGASFRRKNGDLVISTGPAEQWNMKTAPVPDHSDYISAVTKCGVSKILPISLTVESSRGCWWGAKHLCTFCGLNGPSLTYRSKVPDKFLAEILELSNRHGVVSFLACDTILDASYIHTFLPQLASQRYHLTFFFEVKPNLRREGVHSLVEAGVSRIQPGIEALDSDLLALMNKGTTARQNIQFLKWCREFGLEASWNLLHGFPLEQYAHYASYPQLIRLISHLQPPVDVCAITFERFSGYHRHPESYGLTLTASSCYNYLFPDTVNANGFAFFFDPICPPRGDSDLDSAIQETKIMFKKWRDRWQGKVNFYYEEGPGFLLLYDNRPLENDEIPVTRKITLRGAAETVFKFCDEAHSLSSIERHLNQEGVTYPKDRLMALLGSFVRTGLMYHESGWYLSLATRSAQPFRAEAARQLPSAVSQLRIIS